jgi:ribonuclease III
MESFTREQLDWLKHWDLEIEPAYFLIAITHPSYHTIDPAATDYERYEFLGDSVIDLLAAEMLFSSYDTLSEGEMTRGRTKLVKNKHLAEIYDFLHLEDIIMTAMHYTPSMKDKANFVEALFGALFLSKGYDPCKILWNKINVHLDFSLGKTTLSEDHLHPKIRERKRELEAFYKDLSLIPKDPITTLQELCLKNKKPLPKYKLIQRRGPDHKPFYTYEVIVSPIKHILDEQIIAIGRGTSKQKAKFDAAAKCCEMLYLPYTPV